MRLAGHIHRHTELVAHQVLFWEPCHGNKSRGRPAIPYVDCLRKDTGLQDVQEMVDLGLIGYVGDHVLIHGS